MNLSDATKIADAVLATRSSDRWFLPGTREALIEAAWNSRNKMDVVEEFSEILDRCEIDDPWSDPCDECRGDRWFYYHPAMVL